MSDTAPNTSTGEVTEDPLVGRTVAGKFRLEKLLGEGAMGAVYRARQLALEKTVAIKVMHKDLAVDKQFGARFHREAKAASRLDHSNSIRIIDYGEEPDGLLYIAMEFLDGSDLFRLTEQQWPLAPHRVADILSQTLAALAVAHDMGVLHRDLKPENIMVLRTKSDEGGDADHVKVCDFGIAKIVDAPEPQPDAPARTRGAKLTAAGLVIGTPEYMSPEQARGDIIDARSDLYSMGVILYYLLAQRVPFEAPTPIGIVLKHQNEPPKPPSSLAPGVHRGLEEVCLRAMSKRPDDRYQSAREMRAALRAAVRDDPGAALSDPTPLSAGTAAGAGLPPGSRTALAFAGTQVMGAAPEHAATELLPSVDARTQSGSGASPAGTAPTLPQPPRSRFGLVALAVGVVGIGGFALFSERVGILRHHADAHIAPPVQTTDQASATPTPSASTPLAEVVTAAPSSAPSDSVSTTTAPIHKRRDTPATTNPAPVAIASTVEPQPTPPPPPASVAPPATSSAVVAPPPPPPPLPPPSPPPLDPARAQVSIGTPTNMNGTTTEDAVRRAISPLQAKFQDCYRAALPSMTGTVEGTAVLHIETDDSGHINSASLGGPLGARMNDCVARAARTRTITGVDTGAAVANIPLVFKAQ